MQIFRRSKIQMILMALITIIMFIAGFALIYNTSVDSTGDISLGSRIIMVSLIPGLFLILNNIKRQYQQRIKVEREQISCIDKHNITVIRYKEVDVIGYTGIKWIPIFDALTIYDGTQKIYIDFTFPHYKSLWLEILTNINLIHPEIKINKQILERLKVDENLSPI